MRRISHLLASVGLAGLAEEVDAKGDRFALGLMPKGRLGQARFAAWCAWLVFRVHLAMVGALVDRLMTVTIFGRGP